MKRAFRKFHRTIAIIISIPIALTVITGMLATLADELPIGLSSDFLISIHTGEIIHLQSIYPILNGLGLIGLIVTGLSMSGLLGRKSRPSVGS